MMQKSVRLLKIWKLCREKRMMTAPRLAQMCGVDERTIYRDLQALCEMGVTIACNGGYRVIAEDVLPQLNLSRAEQLVVTLALRNLPLHLDRELEKIANSVLNKLLDQPVEHCGIDLESAKVTSLKPGVFSRLHQATQEHRLITLIDYRTLEDELVTRTGLEPYVLIFRERAWYLVAWNPLRARFSIYRLDRISKLRIEKEAFTPRPFDADGFFRGSLGIVVDEPRPLCARFTGLAKQIVKKDGRFSPHEMRSEGDTLILQTTITGEIQWLRWIIGFGGEAEIVEPAGMRDKAAAMLREGLARYDRQGA